MSIFAQRLGLLLYERDINKSQLARRLGVSVSTVHRWFTRGSVPELGTIEKISEMFGVSDKWLRGLTDNREDAPTFYASEQREDELTVDDELVRTIRSLTPAQLQRVKDFVSGLKG